MNTVSWILYFSSVLSSLSVFLISMGVVFSVCLIFTLIKRAAQSDYPENIPFVWPQKRYFILTILLFFIPVFIPSERTMNMIAVSEIAEMTVSNQKVNDLLDKTVDILNKKIDSYNSSK